MRRTRIAWTIGTLATIGLLVAVATALAVPLRPATLKSGHLVNIDANSETIASFQFCPQWTSGFDCNVGISRDVGGNLVLFDGIAGNVLLQSLSGGTVPPPTAVGQILTSTDGANWVHSTATWLNAAAIGTLLFASAANVISALTAGATTELLVGGGAAAPVWTTATGTGAPARAGSPTFTTQITTPSVQAPAVTALTLTGNAASTWSTSAGTLTITPFASSNWGKAGVTITNPGALAVSENTNLNGTTTTIGNLDTNDTLILSGTRINSDVAFESSAVRSIYVAAAAAATSGKDLSVNAGTGTGPGDRNGGDLNLNAGAKANAGIDGIVNIGTSNTSTANIGAATTTTNIGSPSTNVVVVSVAAGAGTSECIMVSDTGLLSSAACGGGLPNATAIGQIISTTDGTNWSASVAPTIGAVGNNITAAGNLVINGNVGIGITPSNKLTITKDYTDPAAYTSFIGTYTNPTWTGAETANEWFFGDYKYYLPIIEGNHINSGWIAGQYLTVARNMRAPAPAANDNGTLNTLIGNHIAYGHFNTNVNTPQTTYGVGLRIDPWIMTGTIENMYDIYLVSDTTGGTVTNRYGIYQANTGTNSFAGPMLFNGNTTIGDAVGDTLTIWPTTMSFVKENAHTINIAASATATTTGGILTIAGGAGTPGSIGVAPGAGGHLNLYSGAAGAVNNTGPAKAGGNIYLSSSLGTAGNANVEGGISGYIYVTTGNGGNGSATTSAASSGSIYSYTGLGGASAGSGNGGISGNLLTFTGAGGAGSGTTNGGAAGAIFIGSEANPAVCNVGGISGDTAPSISGNGGVISIQAGMAGDQTGTGTFGSAGYVLLGGGPARNAKVNAAAGVAGNVYIRSGIGGAGYGTGVETARHASASGAVYLYSQPGGVGTALANSASSETVTIYTGNGGASGGASAGSAAALLNIYGGVGGAGSGAQNPGNGAAINITGGASGTGGGAIAAGGLVTIAGGAGTPTGGGVTIRGGDGTVTDGNLLLGTTFTNAINIGQAGVLTTNTGNFTILDNTQIGDAVGDTLTIWPTTMSFVKENAHTISIAASTTVDTVGGGLTIAAGNAGAAFAAVGKAGGAVTINSGVGSAGTAVLAAGAGGQIDIYSATAGAALAGGTATSGKIYLRSNIGTAGNANIGGGVSGYVSLYSGTGGVAGAGGNAGESGYNDVTTGNGGGGTATTNSASSGILYLHTGNGGDSGGASAGSAAGIVNIYGGVGGAGSGAFNPGAGGELRLKSGNAGAGGGGVANAGTLTIDTGTKTGAGTATAKFADTNATTVRVATSGPPTIIVGQRNVSTTSIYGTVVLSDTFANTVTINGDLYAPNLADAAGTYALKWTTATGNITYTSSDQTMKRNIITLSDKIDPLVKLKKLRGVYFYWRNDIKGYETQPQNRWIGMIAQEVQKEIPEAVTLNPHNHYAIDYEMMTAFAIEAERALLKRLEVAEFQTINLNTKIDEHTKQINELKAQVEDLNTRLGQLEQGRISSNTITKSKSPEAVAGISTSDAPILGGLGLFVLLGTVGSTLLFRRKRVH